MTTTLLWIIASGVAMSAIALVGAVTLVLPEAALRKILLPLVALSAGSLLGGAFLHLIPASVERSGNDVSIFVWVLAGFSVFLALEQFLQWHHDHGLSPGDRRAPLTWLILIADGLHNFIGGLAVGGAFLIDVRTGISAWLAAAAHEVPQELGDFGVLIHGGWSRGRALLFNVLSASTFLLGGILAYFISFTHDVTFLLPFAAGNFIYIAAADLIPEVKHETDPKRAVLHFCVFLVGIGSMLALRIFLHHGH